MMIIPDGPVRGRLRPLPVTWHDYQGGEEEVPVISALLGVPACREDDGSIILRCPAAREGDPLRTAVLTAGRRLVVFGGHGGPGPRFVVADQACAFMYEEAGDEAVAAHNAPLPEREGNTP